MTKGTKIKAWHGIARAALAIALDNGGINRDRSVAQWSREFNRWVAKQPDDMLRPIDEWLSGLSESDLNLVCCGGEDEPETIAARAGGPPFFDDLLNQYFDEVC